MSYVICLFTINRTSQGMLELDFESDPQDILLSEHVIMDTSGSLQPRAEKEDKPAFIGSLKVDTLPCFTHIAPFVVDSVIAF